MKFILQYATGDTEMDTEYFLALEAESKEEIENQLLTAYLEPGEGENFNKWDKNYFTIQGHVVYLPHLFYTHKKRKDVPNYGIYTLDEFWEHYRARKFSESNTV